MLLLVEIDRHSVAFHQRFSPWFLWQLRLQFPGQRLKVLQHVAHGIESILRSHQVCHVVRLLLAVRLVELRRSGALHITLRGFPLAARAELYRVVLVDRCRSASVPFFFRLCHDGFSLLLCNRLNTLARAHTPYRLCPSRFVFGRSTVGSGRCSCVPPAGGRRSQPRRPLVRQRIDTYSYDTVDIDYVFMSYRTVLSVERTMRDMALHLVQ